MQHGRTLGVVIVPSCEGCPVDIFDELPAAVGRIVLSEAAAVAAAIEAGLGNLEAYIC